MSWLVRLHFGRDSGRGRARLGSRATHLRSADRSWAEPARAGAADGDDTVGHFSARGRWRREEPDRYPRPSRNRTRPTLSAVVPDRGSRQAHRRRSGRLRPPALPNLASTRPRHPYFCSGVGMTSGQQRTAPVAVSPAPTTKTATPVTSG